MMWFLIFIAYWMVPGQAVHEEPLIEALPNAAFSTPSPYNHDSCRVWGSRRTGIAWCATDNSDAAAQYIQVDLGEEYEVDSFSTWPRKDYASQYIKTYKLSYSNDGDSFTEYGKVLNGNTEGVASQEVNNILEPSFTARFIRFIPITYAGHKSTRIEAYGNKPVITCDALDIDEFLASCSALFQSNVDGISVLQGEINDVNTRLDKVITDIGGTWDDLSAANAMPVNMPMNDVDNNVKVKNWFNDYRDYLIVLSLTLNVFVIGYVWCVSNGRKEYAAYGSVKYVDSEDNENASINM